MAAYDRAAVVEEVRRLVPEARTIAVTGSAAFDGSKFRPDSDIDVVVVAQYNAFAWGHANGRELEIQAFTLEAIRRQIQNPQWHTANWIWFAGKLACAEILWGPSVETLVREEINLRTRLIAGSGLIGLLLLAKHRAETGRRPASLDLPLAFSALRRVVTGVLPIRAEPDDDVREFSASSDFLPVLESAKPLAQEARDLLRDNAEVARLMYLPEHRTGLKWLRETSGIDLAMPDTCRYA